MDDSNGSSNGAERVFGVQQKNESHSGLINIIEISVSLKPSGASRLYSPQPVLIIAIYMICILNCKFPGKTASKNITAKRSMMNSSIYRSVVVYGSQKNKLQEHNPQ